MGQDKNNLIKSLKERLELEELFGLDEIVIRKEEVQSPALETDARGRRPSEPADEKIPQKPEEEQMVFVHKDSQKKLFGGESDALPNDLPELEKTALRCTKCPDLVENRTQVVFGVGNPNAQLMFVGEAPGRDEDIQGIPFVGRAGQLLTKIIVAMKMNRDDVYIANILKCRPPQNRNPLPTEMVNCTPYLEKQIDLIRPRILVALGSIAARALLQVPDSIGKLRGKFYSYRGIPLMVTYHPAYLLRNPNEKKTVWEDMKKVMKFLAEEKGERPLE